MGRIWAAIFFKEYLKTRKGMGLLVLVHVLFMSWQWMSLRRLFLQDHPEIVWYRVMDLGQIPYASLTFLPLLTGCVFCCFQFLPEMRDERFRISLHLPCALPPLLLAHASCGLLFLSLLFAADTFALWLLLRVGFPAEAARLAVATALPWFLAGLYAYLCLACCLLEPGSRARLCGVLIALGICPALLMPCQPGALVPALPWFIAGLPLLAVGLFLPALHYRYRRME